MPVRYVDLLEQLQCALPRSRYSSVCPRSCSPPRRRSTSRRARKPGPGLYEEILKADAEFFKAFFDTCDVETVRRYVTDDFEMFHDKGGRVSTSGAEFVKTTQEKCQRQEDGVDFLSRASSSRRR